jgi:hypothetical protein
MPPTPMQAWLMVAACTVLRGVPVAQPVKAAAAEAPETAKKPRLFILCMTIRLSLGHFPISALMINRSSSS